MKKYDVVIPDMTAAEFALFHSISKKIMKEYFEKAIDYAYHDIEREAYEEIYNAFAKVVQTPKFIEKTED